MLTPITAVNDTYNVAAAMGPSSPTTLDVLANDTGGTGTVTISAVSAAPHGTVSIQQPYGGYSHATLQFTPSPGFTGSESFTYTASDPAGDSATATVTINVSSTTGTPQVTALSTHQGSTGGGTSVIVTGANFNSVSAVLFGSSMASSYTVNSSGQITAVAPAHSAGTVDITVVTSMGGSSTNSSDQFTYQSVPGLPSVSAVSPGTTTTTGGATITITGSNLMGVTSVSFGGTPATSFSVSSATTITAIAPAHPSGQVDVTITSSTGTSGTNPGDVLTYSTPVMPPTVTGLSTSSGSATGGNSITILGTNFTNASAVKFGTLSATSYTVNSSSSITAVVPAGSAGTVDVTVTNSSGTSGSTTNDQYTYQSAAPTVTGLSTSTGNSTGGTSVTISGTNFSGISSVKFGSVAATSFTINSPTSITAIAPAEPYGTVDVTVQSSAGSSATSSADQFTFVAPVPIVSGLSVSSGPITGGTTVTISGSQFTAITGVTFGTIAAASYTVNGNGTITAVSPSAAVGTVDVHVTNSSGTSTTSSADQFSFTNPVAVISSLSVASGSTAGGTSVTISGSYFTGATSVLFGTVQSTSFTVSSDGTITAVAPAQSAATVDIRVVNSAGTSAATGVDHFTYSTPTPVPTVSGLSVAAGSTGGGTIITIAGTHFTGATGVLFGTIPAASFTVNSDSSITATAPAGTTGSVDVHVTSPGGTSATSPSDVFTYHDPNDGSGAVTPNPSGAPVIDGLDTAGGSTAGGTTVTLYGVGFSSVTQVLFGSVAATSFQILSDNSLTAVAPAQSAGIVNVTLSSPNGPSISAGNSQFAFTSAAAVPSISGFSSPTSTNSSSQLLTIQGSNFSGATSVTFGGQAAVFVVESPETILAIVPTSVTSAVNVTVANVNGASAATATSTFTPGTQSSAAPTAGAPAYAIPDTVFTDLPSSTFSNGTTGPTVIPSAPTDQMNHPVTTNTLLPVGYGQSGPPSSVATTTDYGSSTNESVVVVQNNDGTVTITDVKETSSFSYASTTTTSGNTTTNTLYVVNELDLSGTAILLAGNGTGSVITTTNSWIDSYQGTTTHQSSTNQTTSSFSTDSLRIIGRGYTGVGSGDAGLETVSTVSQLLTDSSYGGSTTAQGATTGQFRDTDSAQDAYSVRGVSTTATETDTTTTTGQDTFGDLSAGTFTLNTDGSRVVADTYSGQASGQDAYDLEDDTDSDTTTVDTTTANAGLTTEVDGTSTTSDTGSDTYNFTGGGTIAIQVSGTTTTTSYHDDSADGLEDVNFHDAGTITYGGVLSDGTDVTGTDVYADADEDKSHYEDTDDAPSNSEDELEDDEADAENFDTSDNVHETDTYVNQYGTPTVVVITDQSGDTGTLTDSADVGDDETLGAAAADLGDDVNFEDKANEQDTANDTLKIVVTTNGQVGVGENLNSTETLTETDTAPSTDTYDDPGTEDDVPTGDQEADEAKETSTTADQVQLEDKLVATDTTTLPDGTVITTSANDDDTDTITDSETDKTDDKYTDTSAADGSGEVTNDDEDFDDEYEDNDNFGQNDNDSQTIVTPVAGGTITLGWTGIVIDTGTAGDTDSDTGEANTANPAVDDETETDDETNTDDGTETDGDSVVENLTDPSTGVVTSISSVESDADQFTDDDGVQETVDTDTTSSPSVLGAEHAIVTDSYTETEGLSVSVIGSPSQGVAIDYLQTLSDTDTGGDSDDEEFSLTAAGTDSGTETFSSHDSDAMTGSGHSNVSQILTSNDGLGTTTSVDESDNTTSTMTGAVQDTDSGRESYSDSGAQATSDDESDTDIRNGTLQTSSEETLNANDITESIDPSTGLTTTVTDDNNGSTITTGVSDSEALNDAHSSTLSNLSSDVISGDVDDQQSVTLVDHLVTETTTVGSDGQGHTFNLNQSVRLDDNRTDVTNDDSTQAADGTLSRTVTGTFTTNSAVAGDTLVGTIVFIAPSSGDTTTTTLNDSLGGSGQDSETDSEADASNAQGTTTDNVTESESGSDTVVWNVQDASTTVDSTGNVVGTPTNESAVGNDAETEINGVFTDQGSVPTDSPQVLDVNTVFARAEAAVPGAAAPPAPTANVNQPVSSAWWLGWANPGNWYRGLMTGNASAADNVYQGALEAGGQNALANKDKAIARLDTISMIDPTPLSDATKAAVQVAVGDHADAAQTIVVAAAGPVGDAARWAKNGQKLNKLGSTAAVNATAALGEKVASNVAKKLDDVAGASSKGLSKSAGSVGEEIASKKLAAPNKIIDDNIEATNNLRRLHPDDPDVLDNALVKSKPSGSYVHTHESGTEYVGKGLESRANKSAKDVGKRTGDPVVSTKWESAIDEKQAFRDEARKIRERGGIDNLHNQINSPGENF